MSRVVPINQVIPFADTGGYFVRRMMETLKKQGQIEPLQVFRVSQETEYYAVFPEDTHGNEIVFAARELDWPTLLITVVNEYEH